MCSDSSTRRRLHAYGTAGEDSPGFPGDTRTRKKGASRASGCRLKLDYTYGVVQGNFVLYADLEISLAILKEPNISGVFRQLVPVLGTIAEVIPRNSSSQPSHTADSALAELLPVPSTRWIF